MENFPHRYKVSATAELEGEVSLQSDGLAAIPSAPPAQFGGPGDRWSPETLLVAAVADCFVLSFRAIARNSKLAWVSLNCEVVGTLDRVEGTTKFTEFKVRAALRVPSETKPERAQRVLEKSGQSCLITNSLSGKVHLEADIDVSGGSA